MNAATYKKLTLKQMRQKRWRLNREVQNQRGRAPAGTPVEVLKKCNGDLLVRAPKCGGCGVQWTCRLEHWAVDEADEADPTPAADGLEPATGRRPRTDAEVVDDCNELARLFYARQGYRAKPGYRFDRAFHPQERLMWDLAAEAYEFIQGTDAEEALRTVEDEEGS